MTWDVLQNDAGELLLVETGADIPAGYVVVVVTADAEYLEYMASLQG